jgi:hypothetical protein
MITDNDLLYFKETSPQDGIAISWVIDGDVLYDHVISKENFDIFSSYDEIIDISDQYPFNNNITVKFIKNGNELAVFQTSEYFGSILLSNPLMINLLNHKNGRYVFSPFAKFINYEFEIIGRDVSELPGWYPGAEPLNNKIAKCYSYCQCGWKDN